tara:strand:+ start:83 stop:550 length:468 start_codon:yes stop_codon:yes gene_type:complete
MIDPITAAAAATKAYAGVRAFVEAGKSIEDTFAAVARWQGHASDVVYIANKKKKPSIFKTLAFSKSAEAEAAKIFAARKRIENQRKELITMLQYAYGQQGLDEYRAIVKEVTAERQREVYAQQEARENLKLSLFIAVLTGIAGYLIYFIIQAGSY